MKRYKTTEKDTMKAIINLLHLYRFVVIRNNSGNIFLNSNGKTRAIKLGTPGASDIIACSPTGQFIAIEVKSEKGRLTDKQRDFLRLVEKNNGIAIVARSVEDVYPILRKERVA